MLSITYRVRKTNIWVRGDKGHIRDKSEDGNGPGQDTSAEYETTMDVVFHHRQTLRRETI